MSCAAFCPIPSVYFRNSITVRHSRTSLQTGSVRCSLMRGTGSPSDPLFNSASLLICLSVFLHSSQGLDVAPGCAWLNWYPLFREGGGSACSVSTRSNGGRIKSQSWINSEEVTPFNVRSCPHTNSWDACCGPWDERFPSPSKLIYFKLIYSIKVLDGVKKKTNKLILKEWQHKYPGLFSLLGKKKKKLPEDYLAFPGCW